MAVTDPIYKINGIEVSKAKIAGIAKGHNMTADEYITKFKGVLVPGKTTDSTTTNPNVGSGNTGLNGVDGSSGLQDPLSQFYVTAEDLRAAGDEEDATKALNKRFAPIGISSSEGTSFGSTNAINLQSGADSDSSTGVAILDVGKDLIGNPLKIFSSIAVGLDKTDEELAESAAEINAYIKEKADPSYLSKAQERSSGAYERYAESLEAPVIEDAELKVLAKEKKVNDFSKILRGESKQIGGKVSRVELTPATVDDFNNKEEFESYKQWKKDGYIQDFSSQELAAFDQERKQKYALDRSVAFANSSSGQERMDVLALASEDERKLGNFTQQKNEYYESENALVRSIEEYKLNPTTDNFAIATTIEIDYLKKQGEIQSLQNKLNKQGAFDRAKVVPLALLDFNKDYNRLRQLRTGFKNVGASVAFGALTFATLAGKVNTPSGIMTDLMSPKVSEFTGLVSLGKDLQKESENFQRAIAVDEITSFSDAGRWVAGSTVNLVPSLAMAFTGPAAMPLFFLSGSGGKGLEMAISKKDASDRMIKNKQFLADNPGVIMDLTMYDEMEADAKTLEITGWQTVGISTLYGIGEVLSEKLGTMFLAKNIQKGIKMLPPTTIKEGFKFAGKQLGEGIFVEGGSEFGNTVFQNFGDIVILGEDKNIFEGGLESFSQGALMGGAMNSVNLSKGLRQGYISVLASQAESGELRKSINTLRKITGNASLSSWQDIQDSEGNPLVELPEGTEGIVADIIKDMKAKEQGVLTKLGSTLSIEQAYAVEEVNRKMRLINKRLITASTNPNIKAAQLKNIEGELRTQFDALAAEREGLLSDEVGAKKTKESYVDANVSLDVSDGYRLYNGKMANESLFSVLGDYAKLLPEAKQTGLDVAKEALVKEGEAEPTVDQIKQKAQNTYVDSVYKERIIKGKKFALEFAAQNGLDLKEETFDFETEAEANEAYLQAMIGANIQVDGEVEVTEENKTEYPDNKIGDKIPVLLKEQILNGQIEGTEHNGTIYVNMNVAVNNKRIGIYAHEVLHKYAKEKYGENQDSVDKAGEDLLTYLEQNQPDLYAKVKFRIDQSYAEKDKDGNLLKGEFYYEEAMNAMSDLLADGQIVNESTMSQIRAFANSFLAGLKPEYFKKEQGRDAYEFVKGFNKSAHFGGKGNVANPIVKDGDEPKETSEEKTVRNKNSLTARQDLKWKQTDDAIETNFKVGERDFKMTLEETAFMEFDEGQTYQDIEDIAKELGISEDKDGDGIESSERFFHYEFGDAELGKDITGTGNALEVFSVAGNGLVDYLAKKKKIEGVIFTAKEPSRIRLYKTLGQALADKIGGSFAYKNNTFIISRKPPKAIKKSVTKTTLQTINALVPPEVTTQDQYFNRKIFNPIYKATEPNGVISNYIKSKSSSKEIAEKTIASIQERLVNYDPAAERKKAGNSQPITFGEFIFANTNFGKLDAKKALFKESEAAKKTTDLDTKEAQGKIAEDDTVKKDRPKFRKLIDSSVLPGFTIREIGGKLAKVLKVLKSKLDVKVSINKSVSPLIAEIKKAMGKQADIDLKEAMGGKADAKLQKWLLKNKKAVLENMTTTWLMGAIPQAIQKSVGGTYKVDDAGTRVKDSYGDFIFVPNFTSDWQGKAIDREKTSTNKSGKTAGGDIVRRLPNIATALSDADFVGSVLQDVSIDADGKMTSGAPIRGKKESMAKALAEEISLEVFTKELQNENSEISKAFESNQAALGVVLIDNFVEDVTRQVERGTVKFSATFVNKSPELIAEYLEGIRSEGFKNIFLALLDEGSKNPLKEALVEYFTDFPGLTKKEVTTAAVEFSKDYVFDKKEVGVTRVVKLEGKEATLDYVIKQISGDVVRGTSYGDVQRMLEGLISKFDLKTLKDLNKGRKALKKLAYELVKRGFSGNQVFAMLSYSYGPSGLGGFKGVENPSGTGRVTPKKSILTKAELGPINYDKNGGVENRGALVLSKDDFIQNFLPGNAKKDGKPTGKTIAVSNKVAKKDFYTDAKSVWNRLTDLGKKKEARELWELGKGYGENLVEIIKAIEGLDITSAARRELVTGLFASMSAAGKIPSTVRFYPSRMDGTLLTFAELVKLFGRKDGVVDQGVFEHTKPANRIAIASYIYSITGLKSDLDILEKELLDYDTAMITMGMDIGLRKLKLQSLMGLNYKAGDAVMGTRYAELITTMEAAGVTFWDAKTGEVISPAGTFGKQLNQEMKGNLAPVNTAQKAIGNGIKNKNSVSPKKIRVFDFDDTLARTKSNVLYTMPDGTTGKIDAATFAKDAGKMEAEGAQWDFSEFSKVMDGKAGPLLEVAKIIADKRGTKDVFVLTARPADAAGPIQEFLASMGLNIPIENITGLGNGTPKAKADWVIGKVADGYNDFYFADDHTGNVKAVKDALDTFDVKGKVQLAKVKFSNSLDTKFNDMIQRQKGVESFKEFSKATAQRRGKKVGKWKFFISPAAEDFRGLTQYKFAGKGKQGEADQKFFEESLMDPYFQGVAALESARQSIKEDTKALLKMFKPVKKKLNKLIKGEQYTYDAAVRVYLWNKAGKEIPGLSKRDNKKLNDLVANDLELSAFADGLLTVSKKDSWPEPKEHWLAQTTLSDLNNLTEKTNRKEYLTEFIENVDIIFSEKNLNKVEALYGEASRKAIENAISAMKSGSNSANQGGDAITSKWTQWVNNSIGTIMFFNRRSAILQTLSSANFINWSDNNPAKAALAFANQPQYWKDFAMIFNSDKLKQRRGGLKSDVQEAEIANAAKNTQDKAGAIVAYILKLGFSPTQIADSFAISLGGASLYRNRVKTYTKQGMDLKEAETKAFQDFTKLSDEAQQSGDPALVSQQQRSVAGRLILSFQNTTMQYTRLMKKSGQDIINGRGDPKTHMSKILYYGAIQNFLFNALSQTAFALIPGFDEEEEDDDEKRDEALETKAAKILNGMSDSVVRGTGIYGAIITTLKNSFLTWERENKKGFTGDQTKTIIELANLSPAIGSKLRKVYSGIQTNQFDRDVIAKHPWSVTIDGKFNPSATYTIIANLSSAAFNLPLDRALTEARGVAEMLDARNSVFQRIALGAGWRTWNVGAKNEEFDLIKAEGKVVRKKEGKEKAKKTRAKNKEKEKRRVDNLSPAEKLKEKKAKVRKKRDAALARKLKKKEELNKRNDSVNEVLKKRRKEEYLKNKK